MKTLYLLRHAKSSWDNTGLTDHDRPLNERGFRAATVMGVYMAQSGIQPGLILCSSARRALETLDQIRPRLAGRPTLCIEQEVYGANANALLKRFQAAEAGVGSILIIGHNPAMEDLAQRLIDKGDKQEIARLAEKYPTGALATLTLPVKSWEDAAFKTATLCSFIVPKDLV